MKKILLLVLITVFLSCASKVKKPNVEVRCPEVYSKNYTKVLFEKYKTVVEKDTIAFNEIRYECVASAFTTHKIMYEEYGKWNRVILPENSNLPILVWNNIDLLSDGKKYTIYTFGIEEWKHIYASVMVFDEDENDVLTTDEIRERFSIRFGQLIRKTDWSKGNFKYFFKKVRSRN